MLTFTESALADYHLRAASDPSDRDIDRARDLYGEGVTATDELDWERALRRFEESYELSGVDAALFNVGKSLIAMGRYRDARDAFTQLLDDHGDMDPDVLDEARDLRRDSEERLGRLAVSNLPTDEGFELRLDGSSLELRGYEEMDVEVDAGEHTLFAELPDHEPFRWEGEVDEGETREIRVDMVPLEAQGTFLESTEFWLVVAGVLVVGAAVALFVILSESLEPEGQFVVEL